jgi:LysM repeat protein
MFCEVNRLQSFRFAVESIADDGHDHPSKSAKNLLLEIHHRDEPVFRITKINLRHTVSDSLGFALIGSRDHSNDSDATLGGGELPLIDVGKGKVIDISRQEFGGSRWSGEQKQGKEKRLKRSRDHAYKMDLHLTAPKRNFFKSRSSACFASAVCLWVLTQLAGCDRMITPRSSQTIKDAETKVAEGNFPRAITLYENALDNSAKSADIHYRLALLYDDKMNDPLNALHHFKRYLTLAPSGPHANEVKNFVKRDEVALLTSLSGDSVVSRAEAARLKNENLALRKEVEDQRARLPRGIPVAEKATGHDAKAAATPGKKSTRKPRSYMVREGDTMASISRKFYKSSGRWKQILDANRGVVEDPEKLKPGQKLTIP